MYLEKNEIGEIAFHALEDESQLSISIDGEMATHEDRDMIQRILHTEFLQRQIKDHLACLRGVKEAK